VAPRKSSGDTFGNMEAGPPAGRGRPLTGAKDVLGCNAKRIIEDAVNA